MYLNPPDNALVLCVVEKSQCQALERTQPMLPMGFGYAESVTHEYVRHGGTTLFAALNLPNGAVLAERKARHRHQEFLFFLRERFFAAITDKEIGRGSFRSVKELISGINHFVSHCKQNCKLFNWTATADLILEKLLRLLSRVSGTEH